MGIQMMVEILDQKAKEKAQAYKEMMNSWAWKDHMNFMDEMRREALEKAIATSSMEEVQVQRGIVKAIDRLKGEADYVLEMR